MTKTEEFANAISTLTPEKLQLLADIMADMAAEIKAKEDNKRQGSTDTAKLRAIMDREGASVSDLADLLDLSPASVRRRLNGAIDFTAGEIYALCDYLHITSNREREAVFFA